MLNSPPQGKKNSIHVEEGGSWSNGSTAEGLFRKVTEVALTSANKKKRKRPHFKTGGSEPVEETAQGPSLWGVASMYVRCEDAEECPTDKETRF